MYSFLNFEPVYCSMSSSDSCFLACIQVSQEAGKVVWYSQLLKNFSQFVVIHTVKGFNVVNEAEVDAFPRILLLFLWSNMLAIWYWYGLHGGSLLKWIIVLTLQTEDVKVTHETDYIAQVTSCFRPWHLVSQDYVTTLPWNTSGSLKTTWLSDSSCRLKIN